MLTEQARRVGCWAHGVCLLWLFVLPGGVQAAVIGVLYPEIREPYRSVFLNMGRGIEETVVGHQVVYRALARGDGTPAIRAWVREQSVDVVVALGNRAHRAAVPLRADIPVLVGAVLASPALREMDAVGVALDPHPEALFAALRRFAPGVRTVHVVLSERRSAWLLPFAREAARQHGLLLQAHTVAGLGESAQVFEGIIHRADSRRDALWLVQDSTVVDNSAVLPFVLREAWRRDLVVFSSTPEHVKRGALFGAFPDHVAAGRRLGALASALADGRNGRLRLEPLAGVRFAFNTRTADHLGLRVSQRARAMISLEFPAR